MDIANAMQQLAPHFIPATYQAILVALEEHDELSQHELFSMLKCDRSALSVALKKMSTIYKVIHLSHWRPKEGGGRPSPVYRMGSGNNKRRPKPKTAAELCADWRARNEKKVPPPRQSFTEMLGALHAS